MLADKKKLMIVAILAVVVIGVGAFLFTGGSAQPPARVAKGAKTLSSRSSMANRGGLTNTGTPTTGTPNGVPGSAVTPGTPGGQASSTGLLASALPAEPDLSARDPFDGAKYLPADTKKPAPAPAATKPATKLTTSPAGKPENLGSLPPMQIGKSSPFPTKINTPQVVFDYSLNGVINGDVPLAVFVDSKGNQRLVKEGASLDGDTKVVAIGRDTVTVSFHGKTKTLTVGADTPTEKRTDEK